MKASYIMFLEYLGMIGVPVLLVLLALSALLFPDALLQRILLVLIAAEQDILGRLIDPGQLLQQVADVGADAEVVQFPGVDPDSHAPYHNRGAPRQRGGAGSAPGEGSLPRTFR